MAKGSLRVNGIIVDTDGEITASTGDSIVIREDDGSAVITVDTSGNVGINTTAPGAQFDIRGSAGTGAASASVLRMSTAETTIVDGDVLGMIQFIAPLEASGTDAIEIAACIQAEADDTFAADNNAAELVFKTAASEAATEKMRITSDGNVGIGTTAPSVSLVVQKDQNATTANYIVNDGTGTAAQAQTRWYSNSALGIATVCDDGYSSSGVYVADAFSVFSAGSASGGMVVGTEGNHDLMFYTNNTHRMRITSDGNVGIGTSTPAKHLVISDDATSGNIPTIRLNSTEGNVGSGDTIGIIDWKSADSGRSGDPAASIKAISSIADGSHTDLLFSTGEDGTAAAERMRITSSGKVGIGTTAPEKTFEIKDTSNSASAEIVKVYHNRGAGNVANGDLNLIKFQSKSNYSSGGADEGGIVGGIGLVSINVSHASRAGGLVFYTNSVADFTEKMRITHDGKVGIGENDPDCTFVVGAQSGTDRNTTAVAMFHGANQTLTSGGTGQIGVQATTYGQDIGGQIGFSIHRQSSLASPLTGAVIAGRKENGTNADYATYLHFGTRANGSSPAERMRITSDGKVGIGTTAPSGTFHVHSTSSYTYIDGSSVVLNRIYDGVGSGDFQSAKGRGTIASPTAVQDGDGLWVGSCRGHDGTAMKSAGSTKFSVDGTVTANKLGSKWQVSTNVDTAGQADTAAVRMTIRHNGRVGIGTTNPSELFHVFGGNDSWISRIRNDTAAGNGLLIDGGNNTSSYFPCIMRTQANADVFRFRSDGDAQKNSGATVWSNYSDERLKEEITSLDTSDCLDIVSAMKPKKFKWKNVDLHDSVLKDDDGFCYGFIAQDLMENDILKIWVSTAEKREGEPDNADDELVKTASRVGNDENKIHSASIGMDVALYAGAMQELLKKNNALEARIKALEDA